LIVVIHESPDINHFSVVIPHYKFCHAFYVKNQKIY
jgi:hypothetical protein